MNRRELRKAIKAYRNRVPGAGRTIVFLVATAERVPRSLRSHLAEAATASLICDTHEHAPGTAPPYHTCYAAREEAIERLAEVVCDVFTPRTKPLTEQAVTKDPSKDSPAST
jgi:hypothetical protein